MGFPLMTLDDLELL